MLNQLQPPSYASNNAGILLKRGLLVFIVVLFFCDIAIYLSLAVSARLQPQYWIALLVVLGGALAWVSPQTRGRVFRTPVFFWCVLFLVLTLVLYAVVPTSHIEQLKERIRDVVLLIAFLDIFLMLQGDLNFVRRLLVAAVVVGVVINLVSLVHPEFLRPPGVTWPYRPGGFYINPNESGIALIIGMVLSFSVLPQRWREVYTVLVAVGIAPTFSREAALLWFLVTVCLCVFGMLKWTRLVLTLVIVGLGAALFFFLLVEAHVIHVATLDFYKYAIDRFNVFFKGIRGQASDEYRLQLVKAGWALFLAHPLIGNGLGSTYHWNLPTSTHNMYLLYADDYGIIGFFLYPLLMWCMVRGAVGETRELAWTMAIFLLAWGFFDHNVVQNYYSLFAIALTAAMVKISVDEAERVKIEQPGEAAPA